MPETRIAYHARAVSEPDIHALAGALADLARAVFPWRTAQCVPVETHLPTVDLIDPDRPDPVPISGAHLVGARLRLSAVEEAYHSAFFPGTHTTDVPFVALITGTTRRGDASPWVGHLVHPVEQDGVVRLYVGAECTVRYDPSPGDIDQLLTWVQAHYLPTLARADGWPLEPSPSRPPPSPLMELRPDDRARWETAAQPELRHRLDVARRLRQPEFAGVLIAEPTLIHVLQSHPARRRADVRQLRPPLPLGGTVSDTPQAAWQAVRPRWAEEQPDATPHQRTATLLAWLRTHDVSTPRTVLPPRT